MTRPILTLCAPALSLLAGCGGADANASRAGEERLVSGFYEQSAGERRGQLCLLERDGRTGFGLITWGRGDANCSGSGTVRSENGRLTLALDGDDRCTLEARSEGDEVQVTSGLSAECARYYCAGGASLDNVRFRRTESGAEGVAKVRDLVGAPLCADGAATSNND